MNYATGGHVCFALDLLMPGPEKQFHEMLAALLQLKLCSIRSCSSDG